MAASSPMFSRPDCRTNTIDPPDRASNRTDRVDPVRRACTEMSGLNPMSTPASISAFSPAASRWTASSNRSATRFMESVTRTERNLVRLSFFTFFLDLRRNV